MFPIEDLMKNNDTGDIVDTNTGANTNNNRLSRWHHNSSRIIRVSRASGGKDRNSKVWTSKGARDRRVRLSVSTAFQFYDLQDRLGYDQPSKAIEWLIKAAEESISELPSLNTSNFPKIDGGGGEEEPNQTGTGLGVSKSACCSSNSDTSKNSSGCSSNSDTSKNSSVCSSSGLSLSRSELRDKARERARERTAKERDHSTTSFTDLLNSGSDPVNVNRDWMVQAQTQAPSSSSPMEYFSSGANTNNNRLSRWHHNSSRIIRALDRNSKVCTSKGARDRRVRLSVSTAIQFYDLQDRLGYDRPSKAIEWLIKAAEESISELPSLNTSNFPMIDGGEEMKGNETMLSFGSNKNLKGMGSQLNSVLSLLKCSQSSAPQIVGLWGMAGIGKTTMAREIFRTLAERYEVCYFLPDFHLMCQTKGLTCMRDEFVSKIFGEDNVFIDACDTKLSFTRDRFLDKRVLIVLDDVSNARDAEVLVGGFGWFSGGHTIIVTSRNRQVLVQCNAKEIYEVQKLSEPESVQLCRQYTTEIFWISELVKYASGNPLALQVLCSALQKQCIKDEQHLSVLRQHPPVEIQDAFRRSFNVLDDDEKNIFLDLACFFRGENKDRVVNILDGCGFFTDIGIQGLLDESLINLVDNKIEMQNIFQDTGRFVVRQEYEEAGKCSRLWDSDDIVDMLISNSGTEAVEGIFLDGSGLTFELSSTVFEKTHRLRLLKLHCPASENDCKICLPQGLYSLPDALRLLHWERYPLGSLPRNFNPKNLVELNMPYSNLTKLWKGKKNLEKLKRIILSHSQQLTEFPRLSKARNLEHIDLEGCTSLVKVNSSILHHQKLTFLSLKGCTHLRIMPTTVHLESLEVLNLSGCSELEDLHDFSPNLVELYLSGTAIREIPSSLGDLTRLATLDLQNCDRLQHLPPGISKLKAVVMLSTKHPGYSMNLSRVVETAPPHKVCRLKRVIQSVILSLRKRKREKSVFTAINQVLPERPGQPECQNYMKTGGCIDGNVCKFHHPKDRETRVAEISSSMASETPDLHLPEISFPLGASSSSELVEASTKKLRILESTSSMVEMTQETVGRDTTESNQGEEKHKFASEESLTSSWLAK